MNISEEKLTGQLNEIRKKLLGSRDKRIHPFKDDKVLTDWNGLMVAALARGAQVFNEPVFAEAARRAISFILNRLRTSEGRLLHRFRDGIASIPATVDDYAFIIWGLLELYEATFEIGHLDTALMLNKHLLDHFWDKKDGGFYFTPDDGEELLVRQKEAHDGAVPSGNSVSMLNLLASGTDNGKHRIRKYVCCHRKNVLRQSRPVSNCIHPASGSARFCPGTII